jgi:uncharacterized protein GlcG (DUF336 family)
VVDAAPTRAADLDPPMNIAVVDAGGTRKAFDRTDGARLGGIDISTRKARTARLFDRNTGDIGEPSQPGGPLDNIEVSHGGLITFPAAVPLRHDAGVIFGVDRRLREHRGQRPRGGGRKGPQPSTEVVTHRWSTLIVPGRRAALEQAPTAHAHLQPTPL